MSSSKPRIIGVIPARFGSSRFPGKILASVAGKSMIQRVYEQSLKASLIDELYVAVDDPRVLEHVQQFGGKAVLTSPHHQSGTDRIAEVVSKMACEIVVNVQGDQPLIDPEMIDLAIQPMITDASIPMSTIKARILRPEDLHNPNKVKVVVDENDFALYFSRSLVPFPRDQKENIEAYEHLGLYVYRRDFLLQYSKWPQSRLEKIEMLEQLRVMERGYQIKVIEVSHSLSEVSGFCVDTPDDLAKLEQLLAGKI
jgi:3-deoxy-manno-octulosonate cytidylyltransferase (CMP-KDO synthetase)